MPALPYSTMHYGADCFTLRKLGLWHSDPTNFSNSYSEIKLIITGSQYDGMDRRVLFYVDGAFKRFDNNTLTIVNQIPDVDSVTVSDVVEYGNSVGELDGVNNVNVFIGKTVVFYVALVNEDTTEHLASPTIKISFECKTGEPVLEKEVDDPIFELAPSCVKALNCDITASAGASATITARYHDPATDIWSDYQNLIEILGKTIDKIQTKRKYSVSEVSENIYVSSSEIILQYGDEKFINVGYDADLFSVEVDYENQLGTCYALIRHKELLDSTIDAFVSFKKPKSHRELIHIGSYPALHDTFILGPNSVGDFYIDPNSLKLFKGDNTPIINFDFDTDTAKATINSFGGETFEVYASYDYGLDSETWLPMTPTAQQPYGDGTFLSRFNYTLSDEDLDGQTIAAIRFYLNRPLGHTVDQSLGLATGSTQLFLLPHFAIPDTIVINTDKFSYDPEFRVLSTTGREDEELIISYDWKAEQHQLKSWCAGFTIAI